MSIYLTAIIEAKTGAANTLRPLLETLTDASRAEEACIQYDLHESVEQEGLFIFHEEWVDQPGLDLHNQQPHIHAFQKAANGLLAREVVLHKTRRVK